MKKHPYITSTITAIMLAIVVWLCVPKYYSAYTKLSDEYKETNLSIGLTKLEAQINTDNADEGINNMEVYCKLILTEDFIRNISHKILSSQNKTYGAYIIANKHWWQSSKDTINLIRENINYNYSNREETLKIQVRDKNAITASEILDSITVTLQDVITLDRRKVIKETLKNFLSERQIAEKKYHDAMDSLAIYADSHKNSSFEIEKTEIERLQKKVGQTLSYYNGVSLACVRQKALLQKSYCSFEIIVSNVVPQHNDSHLIGYILSFVLLALIFTDFAIKYQKRKSEATLKIDWGNIFAPWNITIAIWAVMLFLISINTIIEPISEQFYKSLFIWLIFFCLSSFLSYNLSKSNGKENEIANIRINKTIFNILFVIAMCMTPLYIYEVYKIVTMFDTTNALSNVRELSAHGEGFGLLNLTLVVDEVLLIVALLHYPKIPLWKLIAIIFAWIVYCVGTMAKGYFFMLFIYSIYVMYERKVVKKRTMILSAGILLIFFYFFNLMRATEGSSYRENETLLNFIGMYVLSGPAAYGHVMEGISDKFGPNVFWAVDYYIGRFFTGEEIIHSMHKDFVYVPIPTNTYTILRPFYVDFGYIGIALFALVYGVISGYTYRLARNHNDWGRCVYCYVLYFLVMQFFDEIATEGPMQIIQIVVLMYIVVHQYGKTKKSKLC